MIKKITLYILSIFIIILNIIIDLNIKNYLSILDNAFNKNINLGTNLYALICFLIAFISVLIVLDILLVMFNRKTPNKSIIFKTDDGTYGTANWMSEKEITNVLTEKDVAGIILGKYNEKIVKLPLDSHFNKNICVFGSSR